MKIGLIGINMYSRYLNYACPLHVFAFQQFLLKNGFPSTIIDYVPNYFDRFDLKNPTAYYDRKINDAQMKRAAAIQSGLGEQVRQLDERLASYHEMRSHYEVLHDERELRYNKFQRFIEEHYVKTKRTYTAALLEVQDPHFDCYISVSDVIWNKVPHFGYEPGFFLAVSCMDNKWKIAYSASMLSTQTEEDRQITNAWILDTDFVSVREEPLQRRLTQNLRSDVALVLDPVLLHKSAFYETLMVIPPEARKGGYLLLYYVMEEDPPIIQDALQYAKTHGLKIIELTDRPYQSRRTKEQDAVEVVFQYAAGIEEWIGCIYQAECVFTNSFHGCCISILFEKNFFAGRRNYDKITMLLSYMGLSDRIVHEHALHKVPDEIKDWKPVREKLEAGRSASKHFILNALTIASQQPHLYKDYRIAKMARQFPLFYNSGFSAATLEKHVLLEYRNKPDRFWMRPKSIEYLPEDGEIVNDGSTRLHKNVFIGEPGMRFAGYRIRIMIDNSNFILLADGSFQGYNSWRKNSKEAKIFQPGDHLPPFLLNRIKACVAEAVWENADS